MGKDHEAALAAVNEMIETEGVEAPATEQEPASGTEAPAAEGEETPTQEAEQEFTLDPEVPEEIRALVEEPDFEAEAEEEIEAEEEDWVEGEEQYVDPQLQEERKKRIALEKKLAYVEQQRVKDARKTWEQEAAKFYPLANVKKIDATSRRAFLRAAKQAHDDNKLFVLAAIEDKKKELEAEREQIRAEVRAELEAAWGRPISGSSQVQAAAPDQQRKIDKAFAKDFRSGVREMLRQEQ